MAARALWASRVASYLRISTFHRSFSSVLKDLKYSDSHEWIKVDGGSATIGITDHAQDHLGDVVYVELPEVGAQVTQGNSFGAVESVKATSDINCPVSGKVVEVNEKLSESPGLIFADRAFPVYFMSRLSRAESYLMVSSLKKRINGSPYDNGWIIKVEMTANDQVNSLMDSEQYSKFCEEEDSEH